jgi:hypothetical protein
VCVLWFTQASCLDTGLSSQGDHEDEDSGPAPVKGIATYFALLDSAFFLAEVISSSLMGCMVYWAGCVLWYMITAAIFSFMACFCVIKIPVSDRDIANLMGSNT